MAVLREAPQSKFVYVIVASRRARQLQTGARPLVEIPRSRKPTRIAQEELNKGCLEYDMPERPDMAADREGKRRKG